MTALRYSKAFGRVLTMVAGGLLLATGADAQRDASEDQNRPRQELRPEHYRGGEYTRARITLENALPGGHPLVLHLGRQDGQFRQMWGTVPGSDVIADDIDLSGLTFENNRLRGTIVMTVPDPDASHSWRMRLQVDAAFETDRFSGSFKGDAGILSSTLVYETDALKIQPDQVRFFVHGEPRESKVQSTHVAAADPRDASFQIDTAHLLRSDASSTRYVTVRGSFRDGRSREVEVVQGRGAPKDRWAWVATVAKHDLRMEDGRITGIIEADIKGGPVPQERHIFTLNAEVNQNFVSGGITVAAPRINFQAGSSISGHAWSPKNRQARSQSLTLEIEEAVNARWPLRIHVFSNENGEFEKGLAIVPQFPEQFKVNATNLRLQNDRITGSVKVAFTTDSVHIPNALTVEYHLDAPPDGEGTSRQVFGQRHQLEGAITGVLVAGEELARKHAVRRELDWPAWNGPLGNFTALPSGHELVESLDHAELVWKSEQTPPARGQTTRYGRGNLTRLLQRGSPAGGGSSPIVYDGRVYFYYFQPDGPPYDDAFIQREVAAGRQVIPWMWSLRGVDVMLCVDAATGQTIWRTSFPGQGRYFGHRGTGHSKGSYTANSAAGGGRVYVYGTMNRTLCLDAKTGELLWTSPHGGAHVVALDDVAVFSGNNVVALDAATGALRWRLDGAGAEPSAPLHWKTGGKSYIITGNAGGRVVCADAATGEIQWELTHVGNNARTMTLAGEQNMLLLNLNLDRRGEAAHLGAYRITPTGAERAWELPATIAYNPHRGRPPVVQGDRVYLFAGPPGEHMHLLDLPTGKILKTIRVGSSVSGHVQWFDGRLIVQNDASHSRTPLRYYRAAGDTLEPLGDMWTPAHRQTSSYYPMLLTHPIADGRIFIRGARGIFCYDLRKDHVQTGDRKRRTQQNEEDDD
jgi:outer membrane protein assembly factor BamB